MYREKWKVPHRVGLFGSHSNSENKVQQHIQRSEVQFNQTKSCCGHDQFAVSTKSFSYFGYFN